MGFLKPIEQNRSILVNLRFSPDELRAVDRLAGRLAMRSRADLIRHALDLLVESDPAPVQESPQRKYRPRASKS